MKKKSKADYHQHRDDGRGTVCPEIKQLSGVVCNVKAGDQELTLSGL